MLHVIGYTHLGKARAVNQDTLVMQSEVFTMANLVEKNFEDSNVLLMVLDGVGGSGDGALASQTAAMSILEQCQSHQGTVNAQVIQSWIKIAHQKVLLKDPSNESMTTLAGIFISDNVTYVFNIGDSKIFGFNGTTIKKLTIDDSLITEYITQGLLSFEEQGLLKNPNRITHAIGTHIFDPDRIHIVEIEEPFINFILCTDGVTDYIDDYGLYEVIRRNSIQEAAKQWIHHIMATDARDNFTFIITAPKKVT
jgi:protein phosphatase